MAGLLAPEALAQVGEAARQESVARMVLGSGPVVQAVLYVLIGFSVVSWAIIGFKLLQIYRARRESARFIDIFWETKNLTSIHAASADLKQSPVAQVFRAGYQELVRLLRGKRPNNPGEGGEITTELGGVETSKELCVGPRRRR